MFCQCINTKFINKNTRMKNFKKASSVYSFLALFSFVLLLSSCSDNNNDPQLPALPRLNVNDSIAMVKVNKAINGAYIWWDDTDTNTWKKYVQFELDKKENEYRIIKVEYEDFIAGNFPIEITQLTKLRTLNLSYGNLGGFIPKEIGNLTELENLIIENNFVSGELPESIGKLSKLKLLLIRYTGIFGNLPTTWGNLENLQKLDLSHNYLTGPIPKEWKGLKNLETIVLSDNQLNGAFPIEIMTHLMQFVCNNNNITELPFEIWKDDFEVEPPYITGNRLHGIVPDWVKATNKWKYSNIYVGKQQDGYGYTLN